MCTLFEDNIKSLLPSWLINMQLVLFFVLLMNMQRHWTTSKNKYKEKCFTFIWRSNICVLMLSFCPLSTAIFQIIQSIRMGMWAVISSPSFPEDHLIIPLFLFNLYISPQHNSLLCLTQKLEEHYLLKHSDVGLLSILLLNPRQ